MLQGFDFSHWNTDAQVDKYFSLADFVCHKLTEGDVYVDGKAMARAAKFAASKPVIWYHLIRPDKGNSVAKESSHFITQLSNIEKFGPFGIAIDVEHVYVPYTSKQESLQWILNFIYNVKRVYNKPIFVYMGDLYPDNWYTSIRNAGGLLWIARWREKQPDHSFSIWQNTDKFADENLDHDFCIMTFSSLWDCCVQSNALSLIENNGMTPEEVAQIVLDIIKGKYGNGVERKQKLGNKYKVCQKIVDTIFKEV